MAVVYKSLGQLNPAATTETDLYVVPSTVPSTSAVISSIIICNQEISTITVRVSHAVAGAVTSAKDYWYFDLAIPTKDTFIATIGVTIAATDVIRVWSSNDKTSFNLYGSEIVT